MKLFTRLIRTFIVTAFLCGSIFVLPAEGLVIRHDRDDAKYFELAARFPSVGLVGRDGATLIGQQWVLTAAHVAKNAQKNKKTVRFGETDYTIDKVFIHPDWIEMGPNDIALEKVAEPIKGIITGILSGKSPETLKASAAPDPLTSSRSNANQPAQVPQLPDSPMGQIVAAYIKAFNSGDEQAMRAFFANNVAQAGLERRPIDARIKIYREMYGNIEALELRRILSVADDSIRVLFHTKKDEWRNITFQFDPQPPHKLFGLTVEDADPPSSDAQMPIKAPVNEAEAIAGIGKYLDTLVNSDEFSGVVLIAKGAQPVFQKAYGLASKEYNVPNQLNTKFNLGSLNKVFTQIAIGQLIEQGKLSFDDVIKKHLPDYPNREVAEKVKVRHLINMTSGIGDFFGEQFESTPKNRIRTLKDYLPFFVNQPLAFEPGTKEQYSNGGYIVLGLLIEKVSGQTYYDYVRDHIFKPGGMADTDSLEEDVPVSNKAAGYTRNDGRGSGPRRSNIYILPARGSSAGGGYSTAPDLLKFMLAVQANKLLTPKYTNWFMTKEEPSAGGGTARSDRGSSGFAGGSPGVSAVIMTNLASGYMVVALSNYDPRISENVARQINEWLARVRK